MRDSLCLSCKKSIAQVGQCWSSGRTADQPLFFSVRRGRKTPKHPVVFRRFYELSCSIERASLAATQKHAHTQQKSCTYNNYFIFFHYEVHVFYLSTRLARWNNDGAETYGGLARLALIHHICLRPATMTASKVEDGLVCVGRQSWRVGVGIDQSTPT